MVPQRAISAAFLLALLTAVVAQAGDQAHRSTWTELNDSAELLFAEKPHAEAYWIYEAAAPLASTEEQRRWTAFRLVDSCWRATGWGWGGHLDDALPALEEIAGAAQAAPDRTSYRPGSSALITLSAHDGNGRPVSGRFCLSIQGDGPGGEIVAEAGRFNLPWATRSLAREATTAVDFRLAEPGTARPQQPSGVFPEATPNPPEGWLTWAPAAGAPDSPGPLPSPHWLPDVRTGRDGRATVRVRLPSSPGSWTATAHGVSEGNLAGVATAELRVE